MNPFDQEHVLQQDTILGKAKQLENEPYVLLTFEDYEEISNHAPVRRIKFHERGGLRNWETNVVVRISAEVQLSFSAEQECVPVQILNTCTYLLSVVG
jgi:hypothetical protein